MKVLVTGAAGFIGYYLCKKLLDDGFEVVGIDNLNNYYDVKLKYERLKLMGVDSSSVIEGQYVNSNIYENYKFKRIDISDKNAVNCLFVDNGFDIVCNLAAQAGVRYSIENPDVYIQSNIIGFMNILEACRYNPIKHFVFISSSSIYGANVKLPYSENDIADEPVSLYGATKKSDELLAYSYSKLYQIPTTGLRYFTVYGPWGRPDMAPFLFLDAVMHSRTIRVFNHGQMKRDFTYIDDIIAGTKLALMNPPSSKVPYRIYNIGNSHPIELMSFIHTIEEVTDKKAKCEYLSMQPGDVCETYADISKISKDFGFRPKVTIKEGVWNLYEWYRGTYIQ